MIKIDPDNPITSKAIDVWGVNAQLAILQEEAAESISAVAQFIRKRVDERVIAEEIADFFVSASSVINLLNIEEDVKMFMECKIDRLNDRMDQIEEERSNE